MKTAFTILLSSILLVSFLSPVLAVEQDESIDIQVASEGIVDPGSVAVPVEQFYRGKVEEIVEERQEDLGFNSASSYFQKVRVVFQSGSRKGDEVFIDYGSLTKEQALKEGDRVVVVIPENVDAYIFDRYRLPSLGVIGALFAALAIVFAGWRGLTSLFGLTVSVLVLTFYAVPQIMAGNNPLVVSLVTAFVIAVVSIYLAHGFNRRTTVAVASTLTTVVIAIGLAHLFVHWTGLRGVGSEEAFSLQTSSAHFVNLRGLLLGGIIIGALGVLDDITTAQAAAVHEIWRANPKLTRRELYRRGASVGKEHITSLVNTLALAYAGASLPALLLFTVYQRPWWVVANTESIVEEVVRTLVGSTALMMAVPITTLLAVYWLTSEGGEPGELEAGYHHH